MLELQKMTAEEFELIMRQSLQRYISDLELYKEEFEEKVGTSPKMFAEGQWSQKLPDGVNTEHNYFWIIKKCDSGELLGHLWLLKHPEKENSFIYDIYFQKRYRGVGYGTFMLNLVEKIAKTEHLSKSIELHVFKHNPRALKLYEKLGFTIFEEDFTGYSLIKKI